MYYLGFYCKDAPDIYYDSIRTHLNLSDPLDKDLEEVGLGAYRMYLNHSGRSAKHSGYDLLKQCSFDEIPPYGAVLEPTV